jgi:hypothetical protein
MDMSLDSIATPVGSTVVDYAFVKQAMLKYIETVEIYEDHPDNTSYHLPILLSFNFPGVNVADEGSNSNSYSKPVIAWKKCTVNQLQDYANTLNNRTGEFMNSTINEMPKPNLDSFVKCLSDIIVESTMKLPKLKYKKYIKPYCSDKLKNLKQRGILWETERILF